MIKNKGCHEKAIPFEFSEGYNLLMLNAEQGNLEEVKQIIRTKRNLDINQPNKKGYTALAFGVKSGNADIIRELIAAGADVNIKNSSGQSPLFLACSSGFEEVARTLIENGAEINTTDQRGWSPLMIAGYNSFIPVVRLLIENNADVNIQDKYGKTALDRAKDSELKNFLREHTASSSQRAAEESNKKPNISATAHASADFPSRELKKSQSGGSLEKTVNFQSPENQQQGVTFGYGSPQPNTSFSRETKRSSSRSRSIGNTPAESERKNPKNAGQQKKDRQVATPLKHKFFKDELQRMLSEQIKYYSQKMQDIVSKKVEYAVPALIQEQSERVKADAEEAVNARLEKIVSSLNTYFNLKLKYCLHKAGVDSQTLDLRPFLDKDDVKRLEIAPIVVKQDLNDDNFKKLEVMKGQLEELESEVYNRRVPALDQSVQYSNRKDERADGFLSFGNRWHVKNELIEQMNSELKSSNDHLMKYSNEKIGRLLRDENQDLSKKIFSELNLTVEKIEEQIRSSFEESISKRLDQINDVLASQPKGLSPFRRNFANSVLTPAVRDLGSNYAAQSSRQKLTHELEHLGSDEGARSSKPYSSRFDASRTWNQDELNNSRRLQETKNKIQSIKDSLNFDVETQDVPEQPEKGFNRTAPNLSSHSIGSSPHAYSGQSYSRGYDASRRPEKDTNSSRRDAPITSSFRVGERYSGEDPKFYQRSQDYSSGSKFTSGRVSDQRSINVRHI